MFHNFLLSLCICVFFSCYVPQNIKHSTFYCRFKLNSLPNFNVDTRLVTDPTNIFSYVHFYPKQYQTIAAQRIQAISNDCLASGSWKMFRVRGERSTLQATTRPARRSIATTFSLKPALQCLYAY